MKEENPTPKTNRITKTSKFSDQNEPPPRSTKLNSASSWGSHIVKGLAGERKSKLQTFSTLPTKKSQPSSTTNKNNNNNGNTPSNKVKRGFIGDLSCSVAAIQVHPHSQCQTTNKSLGSRDLFVEIENLRGLLKESKDREFQLQSELCQSKRNQKRVLELEKEFEAKQNEVQDLMVKVNLLEIEKTNLKKELLSLNSDSRSHENDILLKSQKSHTLMDVVELRRLNKELQLQKRDLTRRVASMESQLANLAKPPESEIIAKIRAEASMLRNTNEDLSKQVEGLQVNRFNEVEELAYLRWVNAQLSNELRNSSCSCSASSNVGSSPFAIKKLNKWPIAVTDDNDLEGNNSSSRRHSISGSGSKSCDEEDILVINKRRQSNGLKCTKAIECGEREEELNFHQKHEEARTKLVVVPSDIEKRALRVPNPPPRPSCDNSTICKEDQASIAAHPPPPPPPPPPPSRFSVGNTCSSAVQRAPQVVEFYHSLMKRDTRRDSTGGAICDSPNVASVRSNMIGEIENRSSYLLAIKADVETQGEFVNSLIREVKKAVYRDIEDVLAFVNWLDDELCFLVDERAVLKHFDWPEKKADTLREAAFGYKDLKKLESEVTYYHDDPRLPCDIALKKMVSLSEKNEHTIYNLLRTRDSLIRSCKEFKIPTEWMLDSGIISKVKLGSVKLAKKYMNRVATELQSRTSLDKDPAMDYMLLQGVRFAFKIHQFAGGFDAETMQAFEELRKFAHALNGR